MKFMFLVRELRYITSAGGIIIHYDDVTKSCFSTRSENSEPTFGWFSMSPLPRLHHFYIIIVRLHHVYTIISSLC